MDSHDMTVCVDGGGRDSVCLFLISFREHMKMNGDRLYLFSLLIQFNFQQVNQNGSLHLKLHRD